MRKPTQQLLSKCLTEIAMAPGGMTRMQLIGKLKVKRDAIVKAIRWLLDEDLVYVDGLAPAVHKGRKAQILRAKLTGVDPLNEFAIKWKHGQ